MLVRRAITLCALSGVAFANNFQYRLTDTIIGREFFRAFHWETCDDPTHGRVDYVDQETAIHMNYSYASDAKFVMSANSRDVVTPGSRGRESVRITSKNAYDDVIVVLDLQHMPQGCATWPAFWTLSRAGPWPHGGEIDIIEGVNLQTQNIATLHTTSNCKMPYQRNQKGQTLSTNCDAAVSSNMGCGTAFNSPQSYGSGFNQNGGGWFVMRKSRDSGIAIWFWARGDTQVPPEIVYGSDCVSGYWGTPDAEFPTKPGQCDYDEHFDDHQIVFDLTFCGDWAGNAYPTSGCSGTCQDLVDNHPEAFIQAYWEINSLRIYTPSYTPSLITPTR